MAKVVRAQDSLSAGTIEAVFKEQGSASGQDAVETLEAKKNVVITTPEGSSHRRLCHIPFRHE